jgi:hypothetical protein
MLKRLERLVQVQEACCRVVQGEFSPAAQQQAEATLALTRRVATNWANYLLSDSAFAVEKRLWEEAEKLEKVLQKEGK